MSDTKKTVVLIDLSSLAHPIWATFSGELDPNARMRTGQSIVQRVHALAQGHEHVAICCDAGRSFRHDLEPTYKANRPERDEAFIQQVRQARETLAADGFPVWATPGFEADDLIATATRLATEAGYQVQIVSADKDLLALVTPDVTMKKATDGAIYDVEAVASKFGILPAQMTDFLTLKGDASDNIAGAKGIGDKRAAELLAKFGTLDDLYAALDKGPVQAGLSPSIVTALKDFRPRMAATRALVQMRTDAPIANFAAVLQARVPPSIGEVIDCEVDEPTFVDLLDGHDEPESETTPERRVKCDGDHGAPKCADPECWHGEEPTHAVQPIIDVALTPKPRPEKAVPEGQTAPMMRQAELQQALARVQPAPMAPVEFERQLEPRTLNEAIQLSKLMFASRLFSAYGTEAGVLSAVLSGREMGLPSMRSLRAFHIIDNRAEMKADLIRALVLTSGKADYFRCIERTATRATFITLRKGDPDEIRLTFTIEEARIAWPKDEKAWAASGWGKNPADMLVARAGAKLARLVYPDVTHGLYAPEERDEVA